MENTDLKKVWKRTTHRFSPHELFDELGIRGRILSVKLLVKPQDQNVPYLRKKPDDKIDERGWWEDIVEIETEEEDEEDEVC